MIYDVVGCVVGQTWDKVTMPWDRFLPRDASAERGDAIVSRLSVRLSVCNVQVPCANRFEFFENNFTAE